MIMQDETMKTVVDIAMSCIKEIVAGNETVLISVNGTRPKGFPRGELLSVSSNGAKNYAVCPVKLIAWLHTKTVAERKAKRTEP